MKKQSNPIITPSEFKRIKELHEDALRRRAEQMKLDNQRMNQAAVARLWNVHPAIVIRALRTYQPE